MESFCMRLRAKRKKAGKSQADFATDIGMTRTGYADIEHGVAGKSFMKLPALAKALGCRIDDLFPEMDDPGAEMPSEDAAPEPETAADDWPDGWRD